MTEEKNRKVAAYVVEDEKATQYRYRVKNVQEALAENGGKWRVEIYKKGELGRLDLAEIDLLVILRQTAKDDVVTELIASAKELGLPVVMDLDDLIFSYKDVPLVLRSTGGRNILYWVGYAWGVRRIANKVDGFITTNGFLAKRLSECFHRPAVVIRNSLNREQVAIAEKCLPKKSHDGFVIGYFSGSPTHARDLAMVESELEKFLVGHDDVKIIVVGYMKLPERLMKFVKTGKVEQKSLVDYQKLQKMVSEVDVNIAPLVINDFTNAKSELKYFEAGVVETTTIASPSYSFSRAIREGENGFLASPDEWGEKLEYLYRHKKENEQIAKCARKDALKNYYVVKIAREAEKAYNEILEIHSAKK